MTIDVRELIERLNDEAMRLQGRSIDRGCVDSGLAGNLALEVVGLIEFLSERIAVLEARQHGGENGAAGDAIDFACDHAKEPVFFLEDWRKDGAREWPEYHRWLAVQRAGAAVARTQNTPG